MDFEHADADIETTGSMTDQDIVNAVQGVGDIDDNDEIDITEDRPITFPSIGEYRLALEIISHYITCRSDDKCHQQALVSLEDLSFQA